MSCNCVKAQITELRKLRESVAKIVKADQVDYVIYEQDDKVFADTFSGWIKEGYPGKVRDFIFSV